MPYDRALANNLHVLTRQVHAQDGRATLKMTDAAREVLRADETDSVFWLALGSRGEYLGGDRALPLPASVGQPAPARCCTRTTRCAAACAWPTPGST